MNIKMLNFTNHLRRQALIFGSKSKHKIFKLQESIKIHINIELLFCQLMPIGKNVLFTKTAYILVNIYLILGVQI